MASSTPKRSRNNSKTYSPIVFIKHKPEKSTVTSVMRKYGGNLEKVPNNRQRSVVNDTFDSFDKEVNSSKYL